MFAHFGHTFGERFANPRILYLFCDTIAIIFDKQTTRGEVNLQTMTSLGLQQYFRGSIFCVQGKGDAVLKKFQTYYNNFNVGDLSAYGQDPVFSGMMGTMVYPDGSTVTGPTDRPEEYPGENIQVNAGAKLVYNDGAYIAEFYDAHMVLARAFAGLLNGPVGTRVPEDQIKGTTLRDEMMKQQFEGASGQILFDAAGDKLGSMEFRQPAAEVGVFADGVGRWSALTGVTWDPGMPVFIDRTDLTKVTSEMPPEGPPDCEIGSIPDTVTDSCVPCGVGYGGVGCAPCIPGFYGRMEEQMFRFGTMEGGKCSSCPKWVFSDSEGTTECTLCPKGYSSEGEATVCTACQAGTGAQPRSRPALRPRAPGRPQ